MLDLLSKLTVGDFEMVGAMVEVFELFEGKEVGKLKGATEGTTAGMFDGSTVGLVGFNDGRLDRLGYLLCLVVGQSETDG